MHEIRHKFLSGIDLDRYIGRTTVTLLQYPRKEQGEG